MSAMSERAGGESLELEETHWWFRGRRRVIAEQLRLLSIKPGVEILDVGCGSGRNMVDLARLGPVIGLDSSETAVESARARDVGEVVLGSITELPFEPERFDLAICTDVIEQVDDDALALRELRRVLRPGGLALVTVPAYQSLWGKPDLINHDKRRYTRASLSALAIDAGWDAVYSTYFNALALPAVGARRGLTRLGYSPRRPAGSDPLRTPTYLSPALERALELEAGVIARGRRIPAGLSLMLVLRRHSGPVEPRGQGDGSVDGDGRAP